MDVLSLPLSAPSPHHFAASAAAASSLDMHDFMGGGGQPDVDVANQEVHEFVIIYEGPPAPDSAPSFQAKDFYGGNNDSISRSNTVRKNRQAFCLTLPPSTFSSRSNSSNNYTNNKTLPSSSSYVLEQDLLAHASKKIGWPAHLLCCRLQQHHQPKHSQQQQYVDNKSSQHFLHFFPTQSIYHLPTETLHHHHSLPIFITLRSQYTLILGGKGGFGTLLRGQSRQAGAKRTVDFGACRDLSGRRLRHVNDELKLRKWKEVEEARMRASEAAGSGGGRGGDAGAAAAAALTEAELSALRTPSGIRNWHLSIPSWSDVPTTTNKGRRKVDRQLEREVRGYQMKEERMRTEQEKKRMEKESSVLEYVRRGEKEGERVSSISNVSSVKEEILAYLRKRKLDERGGSKIDEGTGGRSEPTKVMAPVVVANNDDIGKESDPSCRYLMTLSGEISILEATTIAPSTLPDNHVVETRSSKLQRIQSQSDFATAVVLLDAAKLRDISGGKERERRGVYIEYTIQTAGLAQIGWIRGPGGTSSSGVAAFLPNSDTGDGVGDDDASFGFDGSRGLKFHGGEKEEETAYGASLQDSAGLGGWKSGDVLGSYCRFAGSSKMGKSEDDLATRSYIEIGYTLNGVDLGIAFTVPVDENDAFHFFPALSLNLDEVVDVNIGPEFAYNRIDGCVGASQLVMSETTDDVVEDDDDDIERGGEGLMTSNGNENVPLQKRLREDPLVEPSIDDEAVKTTTTKQCDMDKPSKCIEWDAAFDLNKCNSVDELKALGPDRLKSIMLSMGVKCG